MVLLVAIDIHTRAHCRNMDCMLGSFLGLYACSKAPSSYFICTNWSKEMPRTRGSSCFFRPKKCNKSAVCVFDMEVTARPSLMPKSMSACTCSSVKF